VRGGGFRPVSGLWASQSQLLAFNTPSPATIYFTIDIVLQSKDPMILNHGFPVVVVLGGKGKW
jgi:hypothetical protein